MTIQLAGIVILSGGESSRMGKPKALLQTKTGETFLGHHIRQANLLISNLKQPTQPVILIADNDKDLLDINNIASSKNSYRVYDYIESAGPLSGIAGAMGNLIAIDSLRPKNHYILVVSCDCMISIPKLWGLLSSSKTDTQIHYLKDIQNDQDYPTLGLYRLDILPILESYLNSNKRAVLKFLSKLDTSIEVLPKNWKLMANINSPYDYKLAMSMI